MRDGHPVHELAPLPVTWDPLKLHDRLFRPDQEPTNPPPHPNLPFLLRGCFLFPVGISASLESFLSGFHQVRHLCDILFSFIVALKRLAALFTQA